MENMKHPTKTEIIDTIKRALQDAKSELNLLGVLLDDSYRECFKYDPRLAVSSNISELEDIAGPQTDDCDQADFEREDEIDGELDERDRHDIEMLNILFEAEFPDFTNRLSVAKTKQKTVDPLSLPLEKTQFVKIPDKYSQLRIVKKSVIVWFLEHGVRRLSNDRTYRVRVASPYVQRQHLIVKAVEKRIVRIGNWCVFKIEDDCPLPYLFLLGRVLSFSLLVGRKKELDKRILEWEYDGDQKNVGALCIWYQVVWDSDEKNIQSELKDITVSSHGFHPCETYVCSFPPPTIDPKNSRLCLSRDVINNQPMFVKDLMLS